ncbi:hypothetical protein HK104_003061, partial [Borealophlyctis nickersoniae]
MDYGEAYLNSLDLPDADPLFGFENSDDWQHEHTPLSRRTVRDTHTATTHRDFATSEDFSSITGSIADAPLPSFSPRPSAARVSPDHAPAGTTPHEQKADPHRASGGLAAAAADTSSSSLDLRITKDDVRAQLVEMGYASDALPEEMLDEFIEELKSLYRTELGQFIEQEIEGFEGFEGSDENDDEVDEQVVDAGKGKGKGKERDTEDDAAGERRRGWEGATGGPSGRQGTAKAKEDEPRKTKIRWDDEIADTDTHEFESERYSTEYLFSRRDPPGIHGTNTDTTAAASGMAGPHRILKQARFANDVNHASTERTIPDGDDTESQSAQNNLSAQTEDSQSATQQMSVIERLAKMDLSGVRRKIGEQQQRRGHASDAKSSGGERDGYDGRRDDEDIGVDLDLSEFDEVAKSVTSMDKESYPFDETLDDTLDESTVSTNTPVYPPPTRPGSGFIRVQPYPPKPKKHDPVARYHQHKAQWSKDGFLKRIGNVEASRGTGGGGGGSRRTTGGDRGVALGGPGVATAIPQRPRHNLAALRPTYVVPTTKMRRDLVWD